MEDFDEMLLVHEIDIWLYICKSYYPLSVSDPSDFMAYKNYFGVGKDVKAKGKDVLQTLMFFI